ncbi:Mitochondrial processing peptidase-like protein [Enhygromyxa salina]|uniref:Mitochondrial processing peptidase-like protein n=1 Tax=Enhygromyxa salina TaxID=215803 RepID=A0A0C2D422_9BACT|nr:pitrilysin family protein [Enhygromyxa salina]KIG16460.1 Mitochondrial processing peptidase-like protein [Enhygromyxa salina]
MSLRLDNGVWVLALPTPAPAPGYRGVVSLQLWIAAGATGERKREHGCAHLLEHMVFKPISSPGLGGAPAVSRDLAGVIEQLGGDVNAFTSHDETVFHATVPADTFVEALEVMVDSLIGRAFDPDELAREQEVVVEEIRQYADDPSARSVQTMMADLYADHPYARPVLGEESEVRALTAGTLQGWARRQHRGERVVLVVAGPLAFDHVEAHARRLLGDLPGGRRARSRPRPSPLPAPRVRVLREDVQEAYLRLGWQGGDALALEGVALDVAAIALGQGESSRLATGLRRRSRLVSDAYASYLSGLASGTFMISAQADADAVEAATAAVLDEIEALARAPLEPEEFARARALLQSSLVYRRETVQGQAHALAYFAAASGRLGAEAAYFEILAGLTPEHVREVCARFLARERSAITILLPRARVDARAAKAMARRILRGCQANATSVRKILRQPAKRDALGIWHATHRSGLRIVARPDPSLGIVAAWLVWPGGLRLEAARDAGISSLTGALLNRGSASRDGDTLAREIEGLAAVLDGFSGYNSIGLQTESLAEHFSPVLARAFECALDPSFAPDEIDEARRIVVADLDADADDPGHLAYRQMLADLYGAHPHGRDLRGNHSSLARFDHAKIARNWSRHYPIGRAVLSLAGEFDLDVVINQIDQHLDARGAEPNPEAPGQMPAWPGGPPKWPRRPIERLIEREREQGQCVIGFPGLPLGDPAGAALDVLCAVLGGQAGRLFESLREREGLVYQVSASSSEHIDAGHVVFHAAASQDKLDAARAAIEVQIARIVAEPITANELERAKRWLVGQFESGLQRRSRVASRMVFGEAYGLGGSYYLRYPERLQAVDREQLQALAKRLLDPRRQVTVLVRCP